MAFKRIQALRAYIATLESFREFCIAAQDAMRLENTCLALSEARQELRTLRAQLYK